MRGSILAFIFVIALSCMPSCKEESVRQNPEIQRTNVNFLAGDWELNDYYTTTTIYPGGVGAPYWAWAYSGNQYLGNNSLYTWSKYWKQDIDTPGKYSEVRDSTTIPFKSKISVNVNQDSILNIIENYEFHYSNSPEISDIQSTVTISKSLKGALISLTEDWVISGDSVLTYNSKSPPMGGGSSGRYSGHRRSFKRIK